MQHFRGMPGTSIRERDPGNIHQRGEFWKYFQWEGCLEQGVREGPWENYLREIERLGTPLGEKDPGNICQRKGCWEQAVREGFVEKQLGAPYYTQDHMSGPRFPQVLSAFIPLLVPTMQAMIKGSPPFLQCPLRAGPFSPSPRDKSHRETEPQARISDEVTKVVRDGLR